MGQRPIYCLVEGGACKRVCLRTSVLVVTKVCVWGGGGGQGIADIPGGAEGGCQTTSTPFPPPLGVIVGVSGSERKSRRNFLPLFALVSGVIPTKQCHIFF